ncbi:hypothetical protein CDAR_510271 [Caerostris darwini]|uniref:Uncharacterized protein n=1 Tax=Caerostris darwini TaxID=1538125 RepID=A0AAV4RQ16_9ARAC|nr:hypothetical protein CDAR_510271 [Caerostris darwini]
MPDIWSPHSVVSDAVRFDEYVITVIQDSSDCNPRLRYRIRRSVTVWLVKLQLNAFPERQCLYPQMPLGHGVTQLAALVFEVMNRRLKYWSSVFSKPVAPAHTILPAVCSNNTCAA